MTTRQSSSKHTMPIDTYSWEEECLSGLFVAFLFSVSGRLRGLTGTECGCEKVISEVDELKVT